MLRFFSGLWVAFRSAMRRKRVERELEAELQYHLDQLIQEGLNSNLTPDEARDAALRAMGAIEKSKEECRDARGARWLDDFLQDCRYAFRGLRRNPVFASIAILSLALGIGENTDIFSLMGAFMWRLLPVKEPESLLLVGRQQGSNFSSGFNYSEY